MMLKEAFKKIQTTLINSLPTQIKFVSNETISNTFEEKE
jgi:hypothetical protein